MSYCWKSKPLDEYKYSLLQFLVQVVVKLFKLLAQISTVGDCPLKDRQLFVSLSPNSSKRLFVAITLPFHVWPLCSLEFCHFQSRSDVRLAFSEPPPNSDKFVLFLISSILMHRLLFHAFSSVSVSVFSPQNYQQSALWWFISFLHWFHMYVSYIF